MKYRAMGLALAGAGALGLVAGCADINDTGMWALSTRVPAYAIVNDQLVYGDMLLYTDHTGTVSLRDEAADSAHVSLDAPPPAPKPAGTVVLSSCVGRFRYTGTTMGSMDLRCNNGTTADLRMALIGETRGYGYGQTATGGAASLTFGLSPAEARAHLTVPAGRQLVDRKESGSGLELR